MSKRPRPEEDAAAASSFTFSFGDAGAAAATSATTSNVAAVSRTAPLAATFAEVTEDIGSSGWGASSTSDVSMPAGTVVRVHWGHEANSLGWLYASRVALDGSGARADDASPGSRGLVPTSKLRLLPSQRDIETRAFVSGDHDVPTLRQIDTTLPSSSSSSGRAVPQGSPLVIEPGLDSLVWPLNCNDFINTHYGKKALCVHASASRLSSLATELQGLKVPEMIAESSRLVVWMRQAGRADAVTGKVTPGRMQYLDAGPQVGLACWRAGHSLYFNPSLAVQARYMRALTGDLGMDFGATLGGSNNSGTASASNGIGASGEEEEEAAEEGDGDANCGGDIEIFAVNGRHATPWHFDAQENFTLQLQGTKRWRLRRSGVADPLTNLHPSSSGTAALHEDLKVHRACEPGLEVPPSDLAPGRAPGPGRDAADGVVTVVLRPGSMLYVPAGWWHAVDAEEDGGSLSLNFSCVGARWCELLVRRLVPYLMGQDPRWRGRITARSQDEARATMGTMLSSLPALLSKLRADDILPPGIFNAPPEDVEDGAGAGGGPGRPGRFMILPQGCDLHVASKGTGKARKRARVADVDGQASGAGASSSPAHDNSGADVLGLTPGQAAQLSREVEHALDVTEDGAGPCGPGQLTRDCILHKRPLSVMVLQGEPRGSVNTIRLPVVQATADGGSQVTVMPFFRITLHAGWGTAGGEAQSSDYSVTITAPRDMLPVVQALARLQPFATVTVQQLVQEGQQSSLGPALDLPSLQPLLCLLVHHGYLGVGHREGDGGKEEAT